MTRDSERGLREADKHYGEQALASLIMHIAMINVWNRLNVTTKQVEDSGRDNTAGGRKGSWWSKQLKP